MITFSICIPAYKSKYLQEGIQSILAQSEGNFELIILNDCSPEPVERVVAQFEDSRIRYHINKKNVGAANLVDNWNKCLSLANGEFIVIMGDDDLLEPDYLEEFSKLITTYPDLEVFHCRSKIINEEGRTVMLTPSCPSFESVYDSIWHRIGQLRSNYISDYLYRIASLRERGGFYNLPLAWGSDDITAFIASAEKGIAHSNKPVFKYRSNRLSITSTGNDLEKMEANLGYAAWLGDFLRQKPVHPEELIVYQHLVQNQNRYMQQRKIFTMTKSMLMDPLKKCRLWMQNRKQYGISISEILLAAVKSRKMKQAETKSGS
jgi:glycosyltransferase involved in cell wall biosynthesis